MKFPERIPTLSEALGDFDFLSTWDDAGWTIYPPWHAENEGEPEWAEMLRLVPSSLLDELLHSEYGDRQVSKLFLRVAWDPDLDKFTQPKVTALAGKILKLCYASWARLTKDYLAEYDPVQNYAMTEGGNDTTNKSGVGVVNAHSKELAVTKSDTALTYAEKAGTDYEVDTRPVGSTTTEQVATYESEPKNTVTTSTQYDAPDNNEGYTKEKGVHGTSNDYMDAESRDHTFHREGNIGVMTATQMLEADSAFWSEHNFFDRILADVAALITIPIYE